MHFFSVAVAMGSGSCHILHKPPCLQSIPVPICNGHEDQRYILQYSSCHLSRWFDGHSLLQDVHCSGKVPLCVSVCVLARVWTLYYTVKHHYVQTYTFLYCDNQNIYITYFAGIFSSHSRCWTTSGNLKVLCWSLFWSGSFVLLVLLLL